MSLHLTNVTIDCSDALVLSAFWSAALGRPVDDGASSHFASIGRETRGDETGWFFIKVPEEKAGKNRVHIDLSSDDREAEVARLVGLGATRGADKAEWGHSWTVMQDPEGNEFCVE